MSDYDTGLAEAIEKLSDLAVDAAEPRELLDGREQQVFWDARNAKTVIVEKPRLPRGIIIGDLASLVTFANDAFEHNTHGGNEVKVWVDGEYVKVVLDEGSPRGDMAWLGLRQCPVFLFLINHPSGSPALQQAEFVRFLKIDMNVRDKALISRVRQIKWLDKTNGASEVQHGRESIDRSIQREVLGVDALPEEIDVECMPLIAPDFHAAQTVKCHIDVDAKHQTFRLVPFSGQAAEARDESVTQLREFLRSQIHPDIPVLMGNPG